MKIICIGQNYVEHIHELAPDNKGKIPEEPLFFMKPDTAILPKGKDFFLPEFSQNIHYELELVLRISKEGKNIAEQFASRYYDQITVGLDLTARDLQNKAKEKGTPWEICKSFDSSAPVGDLIPFENVADAKEIKFELKINEATVQLGNSSLMIFTFEKIIAYVSRFVTLRKGDLLYTGTPKGVGKLNSGDKLEGFLEGKKLLQVTIR
jgi:2-keto-4-pentenoate hydratase/2-oxohepta-3-ene-1,7-dioic acid hydratase in catechol pathway